MRPILIVLIAAATACAAPPGAGVSRSLAQQRAALLGDVRYALSIELKPHAAFLTGRETIGFTLSKIPEEALALDFREGRASSVRINGAPVTPVESDGHILLNSTSLRSGANTVTLLFESPIAEANRAVTRTVDPVDSGEYLYTLFVPMDASMAFPCFDQPDLKARFTLDASAPADWTVISNTASHKENGRIRFDETRPISTYLFAFAAGPFERLADPEPSAGTVPLSLYVRKSVLARARQEWPEVARYTRQGMEKLSQFFQQPFPFPKYDEVLIPGFPYGGMEHAGATFLREDGVLFRAAPNITDHQRRSVTVLHELAHQWFGDLVTMRWFDDLWLKEGFAQYMAFHTLAELEPPDEVWKRFYESIKPIAYNIDSTPGTSPIYQQVRNLADAKSAYGPIVYQKAPSLLRVLNYRIGEDAFRDGVRIFLRQHAYSNATWQDLIDSFSTSSKQSLKTWADAWITQRGMPVVDVSWACQAGRIANLRVAQRDSLKEGHVWPISTRLLLGTGPAGKTLDVSFDSASAQVAAAAGQPCPDYVFANEGDHAYGRFLLDERSLPGVEKDLPAVTDPLERALLWGAIWDSVREAQFAPASYVDLALARLPSESDLDIAQSILGRCRTAIISYLSDSRRETASARFEALLMDRMKNAASRDFRIAYFRAFTGAAATRDSLAELDALLAGRDSIPEVPLQQRDRWNILSTLVRQSAPGAQQLIAEESQRDKTEEGRRSAYAALAGVPTPETKRKYFDDYLKPGAAPEDFITASLANFKAWNQRALTLPYLKPALDALPSLKRERKIFFINGWLSSFVAGQATREAQTIVADYLARKDIDPDLRLKVLEVKDDLDRTVRIRERWR